MRSTATARSRPRARLRWHCQIAIRMRHGTARWDHVISSVCQKPPRAPAPWECGKSWSFRAAEARLLSYPVAVLLVGVGFCCATVFFLAGFVLAVNWGADRDWAQYLMGVYASVQRCSRKCVSNLEYDLSHLTVCPPLKCTAPFFDVGRLDLSKYWIILHIGINRSHSISERSV